MIPVMIFISCLYDSVNEFVHGGGWSKFWGLQAAVLNLSGRVHHFCFIKANKAIFLARTVLDLNNKQEMAHSNPWLSLSAGRNSV